MGYTVRFEGGSLGGTTSFQYGLFDARDIHVPVRVPVRVTEARTFIVPISTHYETDVYRYQGERRGEDPIYVYRWVRPDVQGLRQKIRKLESDLAECRTPPLRKGLMRFGRPE